MGQSSLLVSCLVTTNGFGPFGWFGLALGTVAAFAFIFHPRFEIALRPELVGPYGGFVGAACGLGGLTIGSLVGLLMMGSC